MGQPPRRIPLSGIPEQALSAPRTRHPSLADIMGAGKASVSKRGPEGRKLPSQDLFVEKDEQARGPKSKSCPWVLRKYSSLEEMPVGSWPVIAHKVSAFYQLKVNL